MIALRPAVDLPFRQRVFYSGDNLKRMQPCLMVKDLAVNHDLIRTGFVEQRLQPVTHGIFVTDDRHAQCLINPVLFPGGP